MTLVRAFEQDMNVIAAPPAERAWMDYFRQRLQEPSEGFQAPNGEAISMYGNVGDRIPSNLMAPRGYDHTFLRDLIIDRLMRPFNNRIYRPCRSFFLKRLGRIPDQDEERIKGETIDMLAKILECFVANISSSVAIVVLYNIQPMKFRLLAITLFGLCFSAWVVLLGEGASSAFLLNAA